MRISVVIPSFNRANMLGETLAAVLSQTLPPDEIIVVDDGSTDETATILAGYRKHGVRPVQIANGGDLVARNIGVQASKGTLVAFCDSDDLWIPDFLSVVSARFRADTRLTACYSNFLILRDNVLSTRTKFDDAPSGFWEGLRHTGIDSGVFEEPVVERLLAFQPFFPSCLMVRRKNFLELGGWDEAVSRIVGGDFATALRLAARPPLGIIRRPLVMIRKHASNFSQDTEAMNLGDAKILEHVLLTRPELDHLRPAILDSVAHRRGAAMASAFSRRDFAKVRAIYHLLPAARRTVKQRIKYTIATFPEPLNRFVAALASA